MNLNEPVDHFGPHALVYFYLHLHVVRVRVPLSFYVKHIFVNVSHKLSNVLHIMKSVLVELIYM